MEVITCVTSGNSRPKPIPPRNMETIRYFYCPKCENPELVKVVQGVPVCEVHKVKMVEELLETEDERESEND